MTLRSLGIGLGLAGWVVAIAIGPALAQTTKRNARPAPASRRATDVSDSTNVLATLRPGHPRIDLDAQALRSLKERVRSDPTVRSWHARLVKRAESIVGEPPVVHRLIGPRLLDQSRKALDRISTLALLYRLDGDRRWLDRARTELLTAAAFPDWNPSHFLDTAEMSHALGLGYDWLYPDLSGTDRAAIHRALVEKGLKPGLAVYRKGTGWPRSVHNWNQVCNGGLTVAALALAEEEPALAREVVDHARRSIVRAMNSFAPDGGWAEGPGYWNYATDYNVVFLAAVESALGTDFGLKALPGVAQTGSFRMQSIGPIGLTFNYADASDRAGTSPQMLWFARAFQRPDYAQFEAKLAADRPSAFHLIWSDGLTAAPSPDSKPIDSTPLDSLFRGVDVAYFRSAWNDPKAVFVGFKGGDNAANHSHLDLGSFVLDAAGQRWALDLGGDDYNLPAYFGKNRWTYFRLRTESHNTLTIGGQNQATRARAPIVAYRSTPARSFAVADLTRAYDPEVASARRGIALLERRRVLVQDEVTPAKPGDLQWRMVTRAKVALAADARVATLTQKGATLTARIVEPSAARFEVIPAAAPPPQRQQPDARILTVKLPLAGEPVRLAVVFEPDGQGAGNPLPTIEPLDRWVADGPLASRP